MRSLRNNKGNKDSSESKSVFKGLEYDENCLSRDKQYVSLLEHYVKNQKRVDCAQLWFKVVFFIIVCLIFVAAIIFGSLSIWNISKKDNISWQDLGAALAGLGSLLAVIIVLPSKIAEHLFPAGGNQNSMSFISSMQKYDLSRDASGNNASEEPEEIIVNLPEEDSPDEIT